jgi:hydroxymethylglutaryl-CoA lyase
MAGVTAPEGVLSNPPKAVTLIEVGPRDGLQSEKKVLPTNAKIKLISDLVAAGIRMIQVGAFVSPRLVPQMADTHRLPELLPSIPGVIYNYLVLSRGGFDRAIQSGAGSVEISSSSSDAHSRKNTGMPRQKALADAVEMTGAARKQGLHVRASIQCTFGCAYEGQIDPERVVSAARVLMDQNPDMLVLADTTGMATPETVRTLLKRIRPLAGGTPIGLHFHDTRGFGMENVAAAMDCGVTHFDTAVAGIGGCPFVPGAAGNISTETTARMMLEMNIQTGIDIDGVRRCARILKACLKGSNTEFEQDC